MFRGLRPIQYINFLIIVSFEMIRSGLTSTKWIQQYKLNFIYIKYTSKKLVMLAPLVVKYIQIV
jgi:hypothetical protein